nr:5-formyltetrahydrofolate cyclo-ligase [Lachnospiraceae bacterium]
METKRQIRKEILAVRDAIAPELHKKMSKEICDALSGLSEYAEAEQILFFVPYGSEADISPLLEACMENGRSVFCPLVAGEQMEFYRVDDMSQLTEGYKGIREPAPSPERKYCPGRKDFLILPGSVFDLEGNRIGYGKGFYDRFLSGGFQGAMAAPAFSLQIVENGRIPAEETDQKINCIVTEKEIIRI